jgi:ABC-2 type transport system ATP-binding protein
MAEDDVAIRVGDVSKNFRLPHERVGSVKSIFTHLVSYISNKRSYETQHALRDVSLEIKKGEFFGIVGRNGSGKSTLLKIIAGIYQPTKGGVMVNGKLVPFIELGVGFNPELTGRQNVYLNGALLGFSEKEIDGQYDDIVDFAELKQFMDQKLKNYSSGMQVRLAFSMAIRAKADILLIDEVLAVGDADFQRKCFDYFKKLKKQQKTVVFVSHNMDAIREFCDRAILIEKSRVTASGDTYEVANKYSQLFLEKVQNGKVTSTLDSKDRSGKGWARVTAVKLDRQVLTDKDKELSFTVTIEAMHEHKNLMVGFAVKDPEGHLFNGTNTWETHEDLPQLAVGETCRVTWTCPNIYEDGFYTIDVYVYGDGNEMYDSVDDVVSFQVKRPKRSGFLVVPQHKMKVSRE